MQLKKYTLLLLTSLALVACLKEEPLTSDTPTPSDGPVTVGFWMGNGNPDNNPDNTRTSINEDGRTVSWSSGDKVALWAKNGDSDTFSNQTFTHWFTTANNSQAFFTTTLASAMPAENADKSDITYTYYATYPVPNSVSGTSGTTATFTIPSTQDGKMGGGADIMVAQSEGSALTTLDEDEDFVIDRPANYPSFTMQHLIHALRFYVPGGNWGFPEGETIERIVFTMPSAAAGTASVDIADENPALGTLSGGSNTIALNLIDPIGASTADSNDNDNITYDYAVAAIMPPSITFGDDDKMIVKVYSQTKAAQQEISLSGRGAGAEKDKMQMAAGHVTPVALNCEDVKNQYVIRIIWGGNNLGENVNTITFHDANGTEITPLKITDVANKFKNVDDHYDFDLTFSDEASINTIKALAGQTITVKYDSTHAIVSSTFTFPTNIENGFYHEETLTVPYLFFEDFSQIATFNNDCDVGTGTSSSTGNKDSKAFTWQNNISNNWQGARAGGDKDAESVRMSCRFESGGLGYASADAQYPGRIDSAPITGLKGVTKVRISFDYIGGQNAWMMDSNKEDGGTYGNPVLAYGYTTTNSSFDGGDGIPNVIKTGIQAETNGNWNSKFNSVTYDIDNFNSGYCLSWRVTVNRVGKTKTRPLSLYGANGDHFIYLDNIKVQIVP